MTPRQCKMARAAIDLGMRDLASLAKVSTNTLIRFERGDDLRDSTVATIRRALEEAGVEFIGETGVNLVAKPDDPPSP